MYVALPENCGECIHIGWFHADAAWTPDRSAFVAGTLFS